MRTIEATVTRQGQVTIPVEIRRSLGIEKQGKILFIIADDEIKIDSPRRALEAIIGSVEPVGETSVDFDVEIEVAMAEEVERLRFRESTQ